MNWEVSSKGLIIGILPDGTIHEYPNLEAYDDAYVDMMFEMTDEVLDLDPLEVS